MRPHTQTSNFIYILLFCFPPRFPFSHNMIGWNLCDNLQFSSKFRKLMHGNREKKNWKKIKVKRCDHIFCWTRVGSLFRTGKLVWDILRNVHFLCFKLRWYISTTKWNATIVVNQAGKKKNYQPMDKPRNCMFKFVFNTAFLRIVIY